MSLKVSLIDPQTDQRWDRFVERHPGGSIYHHSAWSRAISDTYGFQPFHVVLDEPRSGEIEGILPLMYVQSRLTGNRLVSLPLTAYCDCLIPETELDNAIRFVAAGLPAVDYVELKFLEELDGTAGVKGEPLYATHILELEPDLDETFKRLHGNCVRRKIRKASKSEFNFRIGESEADLEAFFRLETGVRKNHGLPPQPYSFFANIWKHLKPRDMMFLPVLEYQGEIVAAVLMLRFKDTYYYEYSASDSRFWPLGANQLIIWEIVKMAHSEGVRRFDFGRSSLTNESLLTFKRRWGARQHDLSYYYYPTARKNGSRESDSLARRLMNFTNRRLPHRLLQLEGRLLYPHLG